MLRMIMNILVFLIFAGCASTVRVPTNSFIRSENVGQGGASIETFITQATRLQVAQDLRAAPIDGTPRADDTVALGLHGSLGFLKALELYWGWVPGGPNSAGLKLQLWGESIRASKAGNFSLSLALGTGLYVAAGGIPSESVQATAPTERRGFIIEYASPHGELSFGYRPFDILLLNMGYYHSRISYVVTFDEGMVVIDMNLKPRPSKYISEFPYPSGAPCIYNDKTCHILKVYIFYLFERQIVAGFSEEISETFLLGA